MILNSPWGKGIWAGITCWKRDTGDISSPREAKRDVGHSGIAPRHAQQPVGCGLPVGARVPPMGAQVAFQTR